MKGAATPQSDRGPRAYFPPRRERRTGRFATEALLEVFRGAGFLTAFFAAAFFTAA